MSAPHTTSIIPDENTYAIQTLSHGTVTFVLYGFRAVCTCPWVGDFHPADEAVGEGYESDRAHRDAQADADAHEASKA